MLLHIQTVREDRRRIDVVRTERTRDVAVAAESLAQQQRDAHESSRTRRSREAHDGVRGRVVDLAELKTLTSLEQSMEAASATLAASRAKAQDHVCHAEGALKAAAAALLREARATRKRKRLAEKMMHAWRRAVETAEEVERDDQAADGWHAA